MHVITLALLKLTFWDVVADIPHDFAAFVTYAILALFLAGIWYGSRGKGTSGKSASGPSSDHV